MRLAPSDTESVPFAARLGAFGDRTALITRDGVLSYADLAGRVASVADGLGSERRLVLVAGSNEIDPVVSYLAALSAGHPVILVPGDNPGNLASVVAAYDPDVVVADGQIEERRGVSAHDLHPSLALLLSTSGSTGSPKLVRLSQENLQSNAEAIASYLEIRPTDRAATTLPMHYCYGLSVVNSHLSRGAALILTDLSVVDTCFWDLFREHRGTTLPGVPYTFDLLDRVGFERMDLPHLRYLTQAGGRLAPERVRRYAEMGRRNGWDLFVMYGQTEATARMAYLPPDLALSEPSTIGVPIPGGSLRLEPLPERPLSSSGEVETGELVYTGANVMLGYATSPADLSCGRSVTELRTGDVARRTSSGLFEIVGRRNRLAKIFGLRIDLDEVERVFATEDVTAFCAEWDGKLVVAVETTAVETTAVETVAVETTAVEGGAGPVDAGFVEQAAKEHFGLPRSAVQVMLVSEVPRLLTGKPDYRWIVSAAAAASDEAALTRATELARDRGSIRSLYAELLNRADVTDADTFVSLEGDSLSYVEMSIRLEGALGHLPRDWHVTPIGELAHGVVEQTGTRPWWRGWRSIETNVVLRAVAIVLIVGSHANLFAVAGGAHVLLGVAGFNFGRFHLTSSARSERVRHLATSVMRIVVPSVIWIGLVTLLTNAVLSDGQGTSRQTLVQVALLNGVLGPDGWAEPQWYYWFIEALAYTLVVLTVLMAVPFVDRFERRWPFWLPVSLVAAGLLTRYDLVTLFDGDRIHRAHVIFWLFALGWATAKATSPAHRLLLSALVVATVPGFFDDLAREGVVIGGLLLLIWAHHLRIPAFAGRPIVVLAGASLYIYLAHWQVYPHLEDSYPLLALLASLAAGVAYWAAWTTLPTRHLWPLKPCRPVTCGP